MNNTKVVNLGRVRDLLAEWDKVREFLVNGRLTGFQAVFRDSEANETIYLGGVYKEDPGMALSATLKLSAARAVANDDPPLLRCQQI